MRSGGARPVLLTCSDESEQSAQVCEQILEHREQGTPLRQQAVLFRTGHHSDLLELELTRRNIPFVKYGGLKFLESAHIKDVLAVLRMLENPRDEVSWFRVLQLLDGIGPAGAPACDHRRAATAASTPAPSCATLGVAANGASTPRWIASSSARRTLGPERVADRRARADGCCRSTPPLIDAPPCRGARGAWIAASTFADCLRLGATLPPAAEIARIRRFCEPIFQQRYSSPQARLHDIDQLEQVAGAHAARGRFLSELALDPPTSTSDLAGPPLLDEDYLILSTVHSAKGGEWDVVHVIHAADGMIPSDMSTGDEEAIEEERRLFYVALTRARDNLYVYFAAALLPPSARPGRRPPLRPAHALSARPVQSLFERRTIRATTSFPGVTRVPEVGRAPGVDALLERLFDG